MSRTVITVPAELAHRDGLVTAEFQAALDAARDAGGARVVVPAGTYRIGSVRLYGDTELHLEAGAKILGSEDVADYTDWDIPTTLRYANDPFICKIQGIPPHYTRAHHRGRRGERGHHGRGRLRDQRRRLHRSRRRGGISRGHGHPRVPLQERDPLRLHLC